MRFSIAVLFLFALGVPFLGHAQSKPLIPNWGLSDKDYQHWLNAPCAYKSDKAETEGSSYQLDLTRQQCFRLARFAALFAEKVFQVVLLDRGIIKFRIDDQRTEVCNYRVRPLLVLPPSIAELFTKALRNDSESANELLSEKHEKILEEMVPVKCEVLMS